MPPLEGYHPNIAMQFSVEKLQWWGYPMVKKISKIIIFIRFGTIHERDGQIHRQTPHHDIGRAYALHCAAKIVQCAISHNYLWWRPKCCCSADFRLAAFFPADFRPAVILRRVRLKFGGWRVYTQYCAFVSHVAFFHDAGGTCSWHR